MPAVRVAINGFGRIGRSAFKAAIEKHSQEIDIVGINDLTEPKILAHLLEFDTAYGHWSKKVESDEHSIIIDGKHYPIYAEKEPAKLPWKTLNVDVVIESTGRFTDEAGMKQHLAAGAKRVVLSAPAKGGNIGTFLIGVNHDKYHNEDLVNNASCTTNCIAPVAAIILEKFGIQKALMTTVHSVTAEQNLVDGPPPGGKSGDLRRARAAYANIIPTTTGAAISVTEAIPELKGLFDGRAIRVPTIVGSISDFTFLLKKKTTVEEINQAIKDATNQPRWKGIVAWTEDPVVSSDIIGRPESAIVDLSLTQVVDGDLVKVFAWYDNEWGYSNRLVEQVINVGKTVSSSSETPTDKPNNDNHQAGQAWEHSAPVNSPPAQTPPLSPADLTLPPPPPQPSHDKAADYHPFFTQPQVWEPSNQPPSPPIFTPNEVNISQVTSQPTPVGPPPRPTPAANPNPSVRDGQPTPNSEPPQPQVKPSEPVIHDQAIPPTSEEHDTHFNLWPFGKKD